MNLHSYGYIDGLFIKCLTTIIKAHDVGDCHFAAQYDDDSLHRLVLTHVLYVLDLLTRHP